MPDRSLVDGRGHAPGPPSSVGEYAVQDVERSGRLAGPAADEPPPIPQAVAAGSAGGTLELVASEIIRRLEASPLMARAPSQISPEEQELLAALLLDLSGLRRTRRGLAAMNDYPLTLLADLWPELGLQLAGAPTTAGAPSPGAPSPPAMETAATEEERLPLAFPLEQAAAPPPVAAGPGAAPASERGGLEVVPPPEPATVPQPVRLGPLDRFPALRYPNFVLLWTGLIISAAGTQMQAVAVNWLVLDLWHSPLALGVVSLAFALPMIALPYLGGAVADRVDRITLLKLTQIGQMLCAGLLTYLATRGGLQIWQIVAITAVSASFLAFDNPTRQALFPDLVTRRDLMSAISLQSAAFTGAALIGPAIGGVLLLHVGPAGIMFLNTVSFLAVLSAVWQLRGVPGHRHDPSRSSVGPWLLDGFAYVWRTRSVLLLLTLSFVGNLLGRSFVPLLAVFARDGYRVGPSGYGAMVAAVGLGALVGAIGLSGYGTVRHKGRLCLAAITLFCLALEAFALQPSYQVALALLVLAGIAITLFSASIATLLQLRVPRELRGRVMSLYTVTLVGVASLGALASSVVATFISAPAAYALGVGLLASVAVLVSWPLWELGDEDRPTVARQPLGPAATIATESPST